MCGNNQDAKGAIWRLDLTFQHTAAAPRRIMSYHGGTILACDTSSTTSLISTAGDDGK